MLGIAFTKIHVLKPKIKLMRLKGVIVKDLSHYDDISGLLMRLKISTLNRKPRLDEAQPSMVLLFTLSEISIL